jgi:hypothetical protein
MERLASAEPDDVAGALAPLLPDLAEPDRLALAGAESAEDRLALIAAHFSGRDRSV